MSFDLHLFDIPGELEGSDLLYEMLEELDGASDEEDRAMQQKIVDALIKLDPRLEPFERDYEAIAKFDGISVEEAKLWWGRSTELNGPEDQALAQFQVSGNLVTIHWYSGTSQEEMQKYLETICAVSGFKVFDPQDGTVYFM